MRESIAIFLPPLPRLSGGMLVLLQLAHHLDSLGYKVEFVTYDASHKRNCYGTILEQTSLPIVAWNDIELGPNYIWLVPDGWTNALVLGLKAKARCILYMQNWAYGLSTLPDKVIWQQLPVDFIYVSEPVRICLQAITGKDGPIIRPSIDHSLFYPNPNINIEDLSEPVQGPIRIAWMPRKNKALGEQIKDALTQRLSWIYPDKKIQWVKIHRVSHEKVASILNTCHIFLSLGFPEGFALPPLEAMACGCIPVGFSGLGGWDYMRTYQLPDISMPYLTKPWFNLEDSFTQNLQGNGFYVEDANVLGATLALEKVVLLLASGGSALVNLRKNIAETAKTFSSEAQRKQVETSFADFLG